MGNIYDESFNTAKDIEIYEGIRIQNSVHNISFKTLVTKLENWDFVTKRFSNTTNLLLYKQCGAASNPRWPTTSY